MRAAGLRGGVLWTVTLVDNHALYAVARTSPSVSVAVDDVGDAAIARP